MATIMSMGDCDDALIKIYYGFPTAPACDWGAMPWGTPGPFYNLRFALNQYFSKSNMRSARRHFRALPAENRS